MFTVGSFKRRSSNRDRGVGGAAPGLVQRYGLMTIVAGAIAYGSLYPFAFRDAGSFGMDVLHLAGTWKQLPQSRGDLLANLLLYMPLGLIATLSFSSGTSRIVAAALAVAVGTALSLTMELTQFYDPGRFSALSDVYLNVMSTAAGAASAWFWGARRAALARPLGAASVFARFLLFAWLGWQLYPYVPTIDLHKYWRSVGAIFWTSRASSHIFLRAAILWLSVVCVADIGFGPKNVARFLVPAIFCFFLAKILVIGQSLFLPDLVGACLALVLYYSILRRAGALGACVAAMLLAGVVVLIRILPWHLAPVPNAFQWIPFFGFLHGSMGLDIVALCQKFYLFGALFLLSVRAGMRPVLATILECTALLATSVLQIFLMGRSAEITDALMALALGLVYWLLKDRFPEPAPATKV
jgi:VanZ family protein